jgi:hypothetical protein
MLNWNLLPCFARLSVVSEIKSTLTDLQADGVILSTILIGLEK